MVKHNNMIQLHHRRKKYLASSRGPLKVRINLAQPMKKASRRQVRAEKAAAIAPRPLQMLRPVVHCQTQKYSSKVRLGRGFTKDELKEVGLTMVFAQTIGIAVDKRRLNRSEEGKAANVERLVAYKKNLILFPRKASAAPKGMEASDETCKAATQLSGMIMPLVKAKKEIVMGDITDEMKKTSSHTAVKLARQETKIAGYRIAVIERKKKDN
jgi:large subunit ribosomal protein L13e